MADKLNGLGDLSDLLYRGGKPEIVKLPYTGTDDSVLTPVDNSPTNFSSGLKSWLAGRAGNPMFDGISLFEETQRWMSGMGGLTASASDDARARFNANASALFGSAKQVLDPYLTALGLLDSSSPGGSSKASGGNPAYEIVDEWGSFKLGPATILLPPISMNVTEVNSSSAVAFIARSRTSSKINPGNKSVRVEVSFIFRTYDDLVGTEDAWGQIDSLRGLITLFRSAPFLPVANGYLNDVWNIDMLAMESLQIGTIPGFPYAITATLSAYQFNWRALVPVQGNAWDLLNEERFLYHYSRAKKQLDDYVNVPFTPDRLWEGYTNSTGDTLDPDVKGGYDYDFARRKREDEIGKLQYATDEQRLAQLFGPLRADHLAAGQLELYYTDRDMASEMWLSKIKQTKIIDPSQIEGGLLKALGDAIGTAGLKALVDSAMGGSTSPEDLAIEVQETLGTTLANNDEQQKVFEAYQFLLSISQYAYADDEASEKRINELTRKIIEKNPSMRPDRARELAYVTTCLISQDAVLNNKRIRKALEDSQVAWFHEWEIPMRRMGLMNEYLSRHVLIESITCATQNALTPVPIAGKVSGIHQHFGCLGTNSSITLKVIGEDALAYLKERLDRISYAAMRNKDNGVSGFMGVENHLLNLMGMKYAMLDNMQVATIEGQPHTYQVVFNLSDFDVFQQKRETPSAIERIGMAQRMAKGHPILRARQELSRMNAYPDMPLPRRRIKKTAIIPKQSEDTSEMSFEAKEVMDWGPYYDPDYYFNSAYMYYEDPQTGNTVELKRDAKDRPLTIPFLVDKLNYYVPDFKKIVEVTSNVSNELTMSVKKSVEETAKSNKYLGRGMASIIAALAASYKPSEAPKDEVPSADTGTATSPPSKEAAAQSTFDELTVGRTYVPGENEASTASWVTEAIKKSGKAKTITGKDPQDNDILAAISRMCIYGNDERANVAQMLREHHYHQTEGRMVQAFPTCVVYLIDEGDFYLTYKLYDTFYGMQGLMSCDISTSKDAPSDTAVLQFSNIYGKLSQSAWWQNYSLPKFITEAVATAKNIKQRAMGYVDEIENIKLETGMRIQVRFGYSADPSQLPVVFNGSIAEVADGQVLTVVVSGDGGELAKVTEKNFGPGQTEGKAKWQYLWMNAPFVEPQQLLCKILAGEGSAWAEAVKRASAGIAANQASSAAPHFGAVIWDTTKLGGDRAFRNNVRKTVTQVASETKENIKDIKAGASTSGDGKSSNSILGALGLVRTAWNVLEIGVDAADDVVALYWSNTYNLLQDFEIYKRNIYPGNGTGMRGWETDPRPHNSALGILDFLWTASDPDYAFKEEDTDKGANDERAFSLNTSGKTNWQIAQACEALMPNYILAVRPFEHRSTLFYGKQNWLYTSGVIPFFDGDSVDPDLQMMDWKTQALALNEVYQANQAGVSATSASMPDDLSDYVFGMLPASNLIPGLGFRHDAETKTGGAIKLRVGANLWGWYWVKDPKTLKAMTPLLGKEKMKKWAGFMSWAGSDPVLNDILMAYVCQNSLYECPKNGKRGWDNSEIHESASGLGGTHGSSGKGSCGADVWIAPDGNSETYSVLAEAFKHYERLGDGAKPADDQLKKWLKDKVGWGGFGGGSTGTSVNVNAGEIKKKIDEMGKAAPADTTAKPATEAPGNSDVTDAMDALRNAIAVMLSEKVGGMESMMDMAARNDVISKLEWRALEDNSYYGVLAGTPYDPYAGAEYFYDAGKKTEIYNKGGSVWGGNTRAADDSIIIDWFENKDPYGIIAKNKEIKNKAEWLGAFAYTVGSFFGGPGFGKWVEGLAEGAAKECPPEIKKLRTAQIMTDNPFTKEFGEPVVEIREPFSRFHTITSETNLVYNGLTANETAVFNQVVGIGHATAKNDGKKKVTVKADASIPPHLTRETVVDTGLNFSIWNAFDTVNLKNMTTWYLKRSLQQMYGGELVVLGNPYLRPYDFVWLWDSVARMNGMAEIEGVVQHYGIDTGYTTSVRLCPIVMQEDAHLFHLLNMFGANRSQEHSLRMYSQNMAAGAVDRYQVESEAQRLAMEDIHRKTLGILDGNPNSGQQIGLASVMSPFVQHADATKGELPPTWSKIEEEAKKSFGKKGDLPASTTTVPGESPDAVASAPGYSDPNNVGRLAQMTGPLMAITPVMGSILGFLAVGGVQQAIGAALSAPLQIITLYKDGRPFQAGLRGARGIIVGEPGRVPLLTDWFGYETLPTDPSTVWSKFGYKLDTGMRIRHAQTEAELLAMEEIEKLSGRVEADIDDEVGAQTDVFTTTVGGVIDGDTYLFPIADLPAEAQSKVKPSREDPAMWSCRMRYIDAPEIPHPGQEYEPYSKDKPNYGGLEVKEYIETVRLPKGTQVKIRYNKARPTDEYARMLIVLIDAKSSSHFNNDAFLKSSQFSWMRESVNGELLTSNAEIKVWTDASHTTYIPKLLRDLIQPLFTVPDEDGMYLRR